MAYGLLKGKRGIIFGALNDMSIAWKVAEKAHEEGAEFTLSNTTVAMRLGTLDELAEKTGAEMIEADATKLKDVENVILRSMEVLGGKVDFILHSIGMSPNVRKGLPYDSLNYEYFLKTLDISALSFHKVLLLARKHDAIADWGSVVALSYVAAQRTLVGYNDMADAKSLLESIARSFGYIYGRDKKIRVNTISQSPYDGAIFGTCDGLILDDCIFESLGTVDVLGIPTPISDLPMWVLYVLGDKKLAETLNHLSQEVQDPANLKIQVIEACRSREQFLLAQVAKTNE